MRRKEVKNVFVCKTIEDRLRKVEGTDDDYGTQLNDMRVFLKTKKTF